VNRLKVSADIAASPDVVFEAITNPEKLPVWWAAWAGCRITSAEIDLKGAYRIESLTRREVKYALEGRFLQASPELLAFTWRSNESRGPVSTVFMRFDSANGGKATRLQIEHVGLQGEREYARCRSGWRAVAVTMARGIPWLAGSGADAELRDYLERNPLKGKVRPRPKGKT
jgi:uncharacterized protein YndB with AHSA1/START domain